ncbi:MAG: hypothetical protein IJV65_05925 [Kiritimatiellae bacterium]|nr:hypothetical protein [Kiritimatiellia bacterium]
MDSLVALGAGAAYAWSTAVLFLMTRAQVLGGTAAAEAWMGQYYFESAVLLVALLALGARRGILFKTAAATERGQAW